MSPVAHEPRVLQARVIQPEPEVDVHFLQASTTASRWTTTTTPRRCAFLWASPCGRLLTGRRCLLLDTRTGNLYALKYMKTSRCLSRSRQIAAGKLTGCCSPCSAAACCGCLQPSDWLMHRRTSTPPGRSTCTTSQRPQATSARQRWELEACFCQRRCCCMSRISVCRGNDTVGR